MANDLIQELQEATEGTRKLDAAIALLVGWKRQVDTTRIDRKTGQPVKRSIWIVPSSNDVGKVPFFTTSLDAAYELAREVAPEDAIGVSFVAGVFTATVGSSGYVHGSTSALALCAAIVAVKTRSE